MKEINPQISVFMLDVNRLTTPTKAKFVKIRLKKKKKLTPISAAYIKHTFNEKKHRIKSKMMGKDTTRTLTKETRY